MALLVNGHWGVDLFFIISGFLMCYGTEGSGAQFLTKRLIRIVPLDWTGTRGVFSLALLAPHVLNTPTTRVVALLQSLACIPFHKGTQLQPALFLGWPLNYEMFFSPRL
jgi:exopolysaccharide production protein ExoZ